jgi:hypothetical protein
MPTVVVGVVFAALLVVVMTLGSHSAVADPSGPVPNPGHAWTEIQGHGDDADGVYVSTENNEAFEIRVNNGRALRLEPKLYGPNVIGGHFGNTVTDGAYGAAICGGGYTGNTNHVTDIFGTVGGGANNQAGDAANATDDAPFNTVGGGANNVASAGEFFDPSWIGGATVGGGYWNEATGVGATVGGGLYNDAAASAATIAGGGPSDLGNPTTTNNVVTDEYGTIGGGGNNQAGDAGGSTADRPYSTVGGGKSNTASGNYATVPGGDTNTASGSRATIGGGRNNTASASYATVAGGELNVATGGQHATVAGGLLNTAAGSTSFAAGERANANNDGCFVWGDSSTTAVNCNTNDRFMVQANGGIDMFTKSDMTTGMYMDNGDIAWNAYSDRDLKENFTAVDGQAVVAALAEVPITTWNVKEQDESIRHMGPVAQDFYAAFGLGYDELHISTVDPDGVALAAIQGLYELSQEQEARIDELEARVTALEGGAPLEREAPAEAGSESLLSSMMPTGWLLLAGLFVVGGLVVVQRRLAGGR